MINVSYAMSMFNAAGIDYRADFHTLDTSQVQAIVDVAAECGYRKPKNASGSTARYFLAAVARKFRASLNKAVRL